MENWRKFLDPEDMTPMERMERIVELLATAAAREEKEKTKPDISDSSSQTETVHAPSAKGRIPFGQEVGEIGRIQELTAQGWSSEKIAKQLNLEDHESKRSGKWYRTAVWRILKRLKKKGVTE